MTETYEPKLTACDCAAEESSMYAPREAIDQILAQHWRRTEPGFTAHVYALHADYWLSWHLGTHTPQAPEIRTELWESWSAAIQELERLSAQASAPYTAEELDEIAADAEEWADAEHVALCDICQAERP